MAGLKDTTSILTGASYLLTGANAGVGTAYAAEDVNDVIQMQAALDTPWYSSAPKTTAKSVYHHWITDTMPAARVTGRLEGQDFVASTDCVYTDRQRLWNITQIFGRGVTVSGTVADQMDLLGVTNEYTYQSMKATNALATDIEKTAFGVQTGISGDTRTMYGFYSFGGNKVVTNVDSTYSVATVGQAFPRYETSSGAYNGVITLAMLNSLSETLAGLGTKPDTLLCSYGVKADVTAAIVAAGGSATTGGNTFYTRQQSLDKQVNNIRIIENDFAVFALVPDLYIPQGAAALSANSYGQAAYLMERSAARVAVGRPIKHKPLYPNGDSIRGLILGELTVEFLRPSGIGIIDRLVT